MAEFIYQMYQARKAHGDKVILDDVTLSFYPGANASINNCHRQISGFCTAASKFVNQRNGNDI